MTPTEQLQSVQLYLAGGFAPKRSERETYRQGRRIYGHIWPFPDFKVYMARRTNDEEWRDGRKSRAEARRDGVAGMAFDYSIIEEMKQRGIDVVGVDVVNGDIYLIERERVPAVATRRDFSGRAGALQYYVPLSAFARVRVSIPV